MSDSSASSLANDRIRARLRLISSGGRVRVFEGTPADTGDLEAFCILSRTPPGDFPGFVLKANHRHRIAVRLGEVIARFLGDRGLPEWLGGWCRPDGRVGSRICQVVVPGFRECYYVSETLASTMEDECADSLWGFLCTAGGIGHIPIVGATVASLVTCAAGFLLTQACSRGIWLASIVAIGVISTLICVTLETWAQRHYWARDPRQVVLDEVAGMAFAMALVGPEPRALLGSFLAFRFFDILKPGIHWVEKRAWPGTIVWDDVLAGVYAGIAVRLAEIAIAR